METLLKKDKKKRNPLVESEMRRSLRLKEANKCFKPGTCTSKKCLACTPNPPDLSLDMIKNLGTSLCQIEENHLSESSLNQKKKKSSKSAKVPLKENMKTAEATT